MDLKRLVRNLGLFTDGSTFYRILGGGLELHYYFPYICADILIRGYYGKEQKKENQRMDIDRKDMAAQRYIYGNTGFTDLPCL